MLLLLTQTVNICKGQTTQERFAPKDEHEPINLHIKSLDSRTKFCTAEIDDPTSVSDTCLANCIGMCFKPHRMGQKEVFNKAKLEAGADDNVFKWERIVTSPCGTMNTE